jgi:hypothetical protein
VQPGVHETAGFSVFNLKNLPVVIPPWQEGANPSLHPTPHAFGVGTLRPLQPYIISRPVGELLRLLPPVGVVSSAAPANEKIAK